MVWATSTVALLQPASRADALAKASARATVRDFFIDLFLVASIKNEAVFALVAGRRRGIAGRAVDLVEAPEQDRGRVRRALEAIVRPRQILPRDSARDVRPHHHPQPG